MQGEHHRHKGTGPANTCSPPQKTEQKQGCQAVDQDVFSVVKAWPQSEQLVVKKERKPCDGEPMVRVERQEYPLEGLHSPAPAQVSVAVNVLPVVKDDEAVARHPGIGGE